MNARAKFLAWILPSLSMLFITACLGTSGGPVDGTVLEEGTGKPISNVIIVAQWLHHQGYSGTVCYHVETATTDRDGKFHIAEWSNPSDKRRITNPHTAIIVHKIGFEWERQEDTRISLKSVAGTNAERIADLGHTAHLIGCYGSHDEKVLIPVYKVLYDEVKGLASTSKDLDALLEIRRRAFYAWKGSGLALTSEEIDSEISRDPHLKELFE